MKWFRFALLLAALCLTAACSDTAGSTDDAGTAAAGDAGEKAFDETAFLEEIQPHVACLNDCEQELFLADVDFDTMYYAAYASEETYADGAGPVAMLYRDGEEDLAAGYFLDPTASSFYPVTNFKTNAEVRENLEQYLSDAVIDEVFHDDFLEYEGNLYLRRGSRGYGAVTIDLDSLAFLEEREGVYYATVDYLLFEEYDGTATLAFQKVNENWILTAVNRETE